MVVFGALTLLLAPVLALAATCSACRWYRRLEKLRVALFAQNSALMQVKCEFPSTELSEVVPSLSSTKFVVVIGSLLAQLLPHFLLV